MIKFSALRLHEKPHPHLKCLLSVHSNITPGGVADKSYIRKDLQKKMFAAVYGAIAVTIFNVTNTINPEEKAFYQLKALLGFMLQDCWSDEEDITKVIEELRELGSIGSE